MGVLLLSKKVFILPSFTLLVGDFDLAVVAGEACRTGAVMSSFTYNSVLGHESCRRLPNVKYCYLQMCARRGFLKNPLIFFSHWPLTSKMLICFTVLKKYLLLSSIFFSLWKTAQFNLFLKFIKESNAKGTAVILSITNCWDPMHLPLLRAYLKTCNMSWCILDIV